MTDKRPAQQELEAAYAVEGPDGNRKLYADWAENYESGFITESGYVYHHHVAAIFVEGFRTDSAAAPVDDTADGSFPVLDVGCGTGIVGEELRALGVGIVDGIDISPEMLAMASAKTNDSGPIYRNLIEADLTGPIDVDSNRYSGMVSAGAFTHGHLGPDAFGELFRVCRPGARCAIGINSAYFEGHGFADGLNRFADQGIISPFELFDAIIYAEADTDDPDQMAKIAVFTLALG